MSDVPRMRQKILTWGSAYSLLNQITRGDTAFATVIVPTTPTHAIIHIILYYTIYHIYIMFVLFSYDVHAVFIRLSFVNFSCSLAFLGGPLAGFVLVMSEVSLAAL